LALVFILAWKEKKKTAISLLLHGSASQITGSSCHQVCGHRIVEYPPPTPAGVYVTGKELSLLKVIKTQLLKGPM